MTAKSATKFYLSGNCLARLFITTEKWMGPRTVAWVFNCGHAEDMERSGQPISPQKSQY